MLKTVMTINEIVRHTGLWYNTVRNRAERLFGRTTGVFTEDEVQAIVDYQGKRGRPATGKSPKNNEVKCDVHIPSHFTKSDDIDTAAIVLHKLFPHIHIDKARTTVMQMLRNNETLEQRADRLIAEARLLTNEAEVKWPIHTLADEIGELV